MVLFGLTVIVSSTGSKTAVSLLILTFLVPAVLFSAVAGVYVDRIDRRLILIATNLLRGLAFVALYLVGTNIALILLLNIAISTITVFFAPAELAMIPVLVPRSQLLAANGIFTLTLNAAFALGFALLGPLVVKVAGAGGGHPGRGRAVLPRRDLLRHAAGLASAAIDRGSRRIPGWAWGEASGAMGSTLGQLREGFTFIRGHRAITWSLIYLAMAASLVGVLGVLGPAFAQETLGLKAEDFAVVVLPLGFGIVTGILLLNSYGRYFHRRRLIEAGAHRPRHPAGGPVRGRPDQPPAPARRPAGRARPVGGDLAAGGRRGHRVLRRDRLRPGRHPGPDRAPGGPARGRPRAGVRRPRHARVGRQLPADHHRRPDLRPGRHDRGDLRLRDRRSWSSGSCPS